MTALITDLIGATARDGSEIISDQIAAILVVESANQQALATTALQDPKLWALRVFQDRSNPWGEFEAGPEQRDVNATPIVNVALDTTRFDPAASNVVARQKATATFNIDCYGYGVASANGSGHIAGDEAASAECARAVRLVRNMLMAGAYTYLGLRQGVWKRWLDSITYYQPQSDGRPVQQIYAARLVLQVDYSEVSPQIQAVDLEYVSVTMKRPDTGQVVLRADYNYA